MAGTGPGEHDAIQASGREDLCRFLAACYYEPDPVFVEERVFEAMCGAAARIDPGLAALAQRLGAAFASEGHECLLLDYTRLFLGTPRALARPYGSIWLERQGTVMTGSTVAVQELYAAGGFEIADDFRELPDHVAVELEFLYLLLYRENEAWRDSEPVALAENAALRSRFLKEHLGCWVGPFTASVSSAARSAFYRELAGLTCRLVTMETDRAVRCRGRHRGSGPVG